jgi:ketosteroid isomerase-like protein
MEGEETVAAKKRTIRVRQVITNQRGETMSRKLLLVFATIGVIAAGCARTPPPQDVAADRAKLQTDALTWFDYFGKADSEGIANLYAEDALVLPPGEPAVSGRPAIKSYFGAQMAGAKAAGMSVKHESVTGSDVSGDLGWISGTYTLQDSTGATVDTGKFLSVHHRVNGAWLFIRDTWNSDRPPAPAAPARRASRKK